MELYAAALDMLLERRDTKRGIPRFDDVPMAQGDKRRTLQGLAVKLSMSNRTELSVDTARACVAQRLEGMRRVRAGAPTVSRSLLERSGVLREPVIGRIDFVHRTVQEFLSDHVRKRHLLHRSVRVRERRISHSSRS